MKANTRILVSVVLFIAFAVTPGLSVTATAQDCPIKQFLVTPTRLDFGEVQTGTQSPPQTVDVTNVGFVPVVLSLAGGAPGNTLFQASQNCQGQTLAPGASCQFFYRFSPMAAGAQTGSSSFTVNGEPTTVDLVGAGKDPLFLVTPTRLDFGKVQTGSLVGPQTVDVTNIGSAPVVLSLAGGAPFDTQFLASQNCQGQNLAPGASCQFFYRMSPTTEGATSSSSNFTVNGQPVSVALEGEGVAPAFLVTPTSLDFGEVLTGGTSPPQTVTVTNAGSASVVLSLAGGAPFNNEFLASQNCQGVDLAPGASCQFFYRYAPSGVGADASSSSFTVNGQPASIALSGSGISPFIGRTEQFLVTPTGLEFGEVQIGTTSSPQLVQVTNVGSSSALLSLAGGAVANTDFSASQNCQGQNLAPGASCQFFYRFSPSTAGPSTGTSSFTVNGQAASVAVSGTGAPPAFLVTPTRLDFGEGQTGTTSVAQIVQVKNVGSASIVLSLAGGAVANPDFLASQNCQGQNLAPGAECQFFYRFAPSSVGPMTGSSNFTVNGQPATIDLSGVGKDPLFLVTPTRLDFGEIPLATTSAPQIVDVTNIGLAPVVLSLAGGAVANPDFSASQNCQGQNLVPGASCQFFYRFTPSSSGPMTGSSNFTVNGQPATVDLLGGTKCDDPDPDGTPPICEMVAVNPGPPTTLDIMAQDVGSGLAAINVIKNKNATVAIAPFAIGTTDPIAITATKIDQNKGSAVVLEVVDVDGNKTTCDPVVTTTVAEIPAEFALKANYPNPFNPTTTIGFSLPEETEVRLNVYDMLGRLVTTLADNTFAAGTYNVTWDARDHDGRAVPSGVYMYRIEAGANTATGRMTLLK